MAAARKENIQGMKIAAITLALLLGLLLNQRLSLSANVISWDQISDADHVLMPEQFLDREIALCAQKRGMAHCHYLAEMFDITNPEWYIIDGIPEGWQTDETNEGWRRKPANEIRAKEAWRYLPRVVAAYISVIERLERGEVDPSRINMPSPFELVYRVTGRVFDNSIEIRKWVENARFKLPDTLKRNKDNFYRARTLKRPALSTTGLPDNIRAK
jgi:hypothetical protein